MSTLKKILVVSMLAATAFALPAGCNSTFSGSSQRVITGQPTNSEIPVYDYIPGDRL